MMSGNALQLKDDKMVKMIDPPEGWKYGFPKVFDFKEGDNFHEWLVNNGYPIETIKSYGDHFYCRYWTQEE